MNTERILCVDDEANVLQAYQRALRRQFHIEPALGGEEALEAVRHQGPYAVVVADMRMPGMSGVELLAQIKSLAPDTVRIMLTGNNDLQTALDAVNEGEIFRFLNKPCPPETLAKALDAAIGQHRLILAEHELLSKTLSGSIKVLTDVLALVNPTAFGRASRVRRLVGQLCAQLGAGASWQIEVAAMLSQIGCVVVPEETFQKVYQDKELTSDEREAYAAYPAVGGKLIAHIPRLQEVAEIISHQDTRYSEPATPFRRGSGDDLPLGSRVLKVALDYDNLLSAGFGGEMALAMLHDRSGWYDPRVMAALRRVLAIPTPQVIRRVLVGELVDGMILADDVRSIRGTLLCARGQEVTPSMRARLRNYVSNVGVQESIRVFVPLPAGQSYGRAEYETAVVE